MSRISINLSAKVDAIDQFQKEIFNRRRKKLKTQEVFSSLLERGANSQSDKRSVASSKNLISDIEKAAKTSEAHATKPTNICSEEWALILSHCIRKSLTSRKLNQQLL